MLTIRASKDADWPAVWRLLEPVFRAGDTYSVPADITAQEARQMWLDTPNATYVAQDADGQLVGTYYIKANQPGQGSHVCNCGYVVDVAARGKGIASQMCEHSQQEARRLGFLAMQYNLVVSTNQGAIRLWQKLGFAIVGTLPKAFKHPSQGLIDAHIMYKLLLT